MQNIAHVCASPQCLQRYCLYLNWNIFVFLMYADILFLLLDEKSSYFAYTSIVIWIHLIYKTMIKYHQTSLTYDQLFAFTRSVNRPDILKVPGDRRSSKNIGMQWDLRVVQLDSTHGCKNSHLDSRLIPSGRAPDIKRLQIYDNHEDSISFD
jgi:hypothetical protein